MNNSNLPNHHHYLKVAAIIMPLVLASAVIVHLSASPRQPQQQLVIPQEEEKNFATKPSWEQDFSTVTELDPGIWNPATPALPIYNNEEQVYTNRPDNVRIENGVLVLEARKEPFEGADFTSGRIDTHGLQAFTYGKIEAVIQFPEGAGTWPAFWMLSASEAYTKRRLPTAKDWENPRFYMHDGELDIVEHIGADPTRVEATAHTYAKSNSKGVEVKTATKQFHTYAMLWTPKKISFTVDGKIYHEIPKLSESSEKWPFDQPSYLILNLAMGGRMGGPVDDQKYSSWKLLVKKVAYYPYTASAEVP